jgi:hypothetical protein
MKSYYLWDAYEILCTRVAGDGRDCVTIETRFGEEAMTGFRINGRSLLPQPDTLESPCLCHYVLCHGSRYSVQILLRRVLTND